MNDPRFARLAELLVRHSTRVVPGDRVLVEATHVPARMLTALVEAVSAAGGLPVVDVKDPAITRQMLLSGSLDQLEERMRFLGALELHRMEAMQAYISLRGAQNITELSDVPPERMALFEKHWQKPVHLERRVKHTRWVVLRWPNPSMAQQANMSSEAFEDFYFQVCLADYAAMEKAARPLVRWMDRTDRVRILGPGTDLAFSIRGVGVVSCHGRRNIPDGECFTAPVRDSVNGVIQFNTPTLFRGIPMDGVRLVFREGRVVEASSSDTAALERILDSDEGARYIGEFALGFNPYIRQAMRDTLFDEKIRGSLHLALGQCYEQAENHNRSTVHWDNVLLQEGGGEVWFDDVLLRRDGLFLPDDLQGLNPEALMGAQAGT